MKYIYDRWFFYPINPENWRLSLPVQLSKYYEGRKIMPGTILRKTRKIVLPLTVVALVIGSIGMFPVVTKTTYGSPTNVVFGVISDTHVTAAKTTEQQRLAKAFRFFAGSNVNADVVVGDLTDSGSASEYNTWKSIKDANKGSVPLIASMGNHEGNTPDGFMTATGNKPNANYVINGYHFITLSPGSGTFNPSAGKGKTQGGSDYSYVLSWLKTQLDAAVAEDPNKPVFVFFHHPIKNTFYVSDEWYGSGLDTIFSTYPQAVTFSGHIHSPNNNPLSIWQDGGFTAVNTVTTSYLEMETGMVYGTIPPDGSRQGNKGMIVEANGSVVTIKNYDFVSDRYIPQTWVFDVSQPSQFPYTHARDTVAKAPVFPAGAAVRISDITKNTATVNFDQAVMEANNIGDIVHSYRYNFVNKATGQVDLSFKTWSEFYVLPMPDAITQKASGLQWNTVYEARIYAADAYGKTSNGYISATFKTKSK
ncbi:MAG TPA: metallophosphoesterase [Desulfitobacteriaceae bacterium]|nr:metallophosphoesterase [Desulfitobacteriaceae bacterium]